MSDVYVDTQAQDEQSSAPIPFAPPRRRRWRRDRSGRPPKPRVRKLRLLGILVALGALAFISLVFGMMMAVASDLPQLTNVTQQRQQVNSYLYDDTGKPIGIFASPTNTVIDSWSQISQSMVHAIVAVEDKRFWSDPGVDLKGVVRAFASDVTGGETQGGSTITEQFIKQVLGEENNRTIFEKLREAALAWQLTKRWTPMKILTQYLNTVYFGNGAYGIESAARVYFGAAHGYDANAGPDQPAGACGAATPQDPKRPTCASELEPWESALLAGMIANPTAFNPFNPATRKLAMDRRNLVLQNMYQQGYLTRAKYDYATKQPLPPVADLQQPSEPPAAPYFTSWLRPQIIRAIELKDHVPQKIAEYRAFYGGLKIKTTIDLPLQQAAQQAIDAEFPPGTNGPTAALVAIDNQTGEVRAMVSGDGDWNQSQFNLAADSERQPGSAFKVFTLAEALATGEYGPDSLVDSAPQNILFKAPHIKPLQHFIVHNFGNTYSGPITLQEATDISDNTVFAQVGMHVGTKLIALEAHRMGIRTPVSTNPAMIIGGLHTGVSPLDMAHAYETLAMGGVKVYNPILGDVDQGPIGIQSITCPQKDQICGGSGADITNHPRYRRVLPAEVAATEKSMLEGVVSPGGTAPLAAIPGTVVWGKTGTTSNYVDAWFVGSTPQMTTAVWVGYPNSAVPMTTNYNGAPVEGGTFPAIIWNDFMTQALQILATEAADEHQGTTGATGTDTGGDTNPTGTATNPSTVTPSTGTTDTGTGTGNGGNTGTGTGNGGNTGTGTGTGNPGNTGTGTGNGGNTGTGTGNGGNTGTGTGNGGNTGTGNGGNSGGASPGGSGGAGLGGGSPGTGTANGPNTTGGG
jgi:penicillin-binding protein 1A